MQASRLITAALQPVLDRRQRSDHSTALHSSECIRVSSRRADLLRRLVEHEAQVSTVFGFVEYATVLRLVGLAGTA